jgi:hypothetical protein
MSLAESFFFALAAALMVVNVAQTLLAYSALPERVPTGLNADGSARGFGPRPMIWLIVAIQAAAACVMVYVGYAIATHAPGTHGSLFGFSIFTGLFNAFMCRVQALMISAANAGGKPLPMRGFWLFSGGWLAAVLLDAFLIG